jgi:hypothetical protein
MEAGIKWQVFHANANTPRAVSAAMNMATKNSLRVCQFLRQTISALRDLKKLTTAAL